MTLQVPPRTPSREPVRFGEVLAAVLTEIKNRGTADVCIVVCDGLNGLPEAINTVWSHAVVQTCVIHYSDTEQAAMKCLYLVTRSLDPTGLGRTRWMMRWKPALNAFAITFGDRFPAAETY